MWPSDFQPTLTPDTPETSSALEFAFHGDELLLGLTHTLPDATQLAALGAAQASFIFGTLGQQACRAQRWPAETPLPADLQAINLRAAFGLVNEAHWFLAARAKHLLGWDLVSRHCGACGTPTRLATGEPAKHCPACGHHHYPQIAPAVMCLVRKGNELLLARSPHFRGGMYSALAGFVEAGESVEACVHREVFEESGIRITNLRWFASQPWPFPHSLMLAFHAEYAGGEIVPQAGEIEDAQWFGLDRLPELPATVSIAARLISDGIQQLENDA